MSTAPSKQMLPSATEFSRPMADRSSDEHIRVEDICRSFRVGDTDIHVLKGVSFTARTGELISIMGSSGSGKSTLLNILGVLDQPTSGRYMLNGRDVANLTDSESAETRNREIGFIFQQFHLLPRLTAVQNVALPLQYRLPSVRGSEQKEKAAYWLDRVGMSDRADHKPNELSGGQRQRLAIARALVGEPSIILADEPTGALDTKVGQEIMDLFLEVTSQSTVTTMIITHDPAIANQCQRRLVLKDGLLESDSGEFDRKD